MADSPIETPSSLIRIAVAGFKSIDAGQSITLAPLTVLAGANSAGKSSIMQPLLLWKQTLESAYDPGPLLLNGPCVRFTSAEQLVFRGRDAFVMEAENAAGALIRMTYRRAAQGGFEIGEVTCRHSQEAAVHTITPDSDADALDNAPYREMLLAAYRRAAQDGFEMGGVTYRPSADAVRNAQYVKTALAAYRDFAFLGIGTAIQDILYLPGWRGNPERAYPTASVGPRFPGSFEPYVASLMHHWQQVDPPRHAAVVASLRVLGLVRYVQAERRDDSQLRLRVARLLAGEIFDNTDLVDIADVGLGVSQTVPVVVALHAAAAGRLVYIEQPELHLHPLAQARMAGVLVAAAQRGVRVVVETHSSALLRGIQTQVARGAITPGEVSLNWFARDPQTGASRVTQALLDADGAFGDWPTDFDDVALAVEGDWLDAIEARRAR